MGAGINLSEFFFPVSLLVCLFTQCLDLVCENSITQALKRTLNESVTVCTSQTGLRQGLIGEKQVTTPVSVGTLEKVNASTELSTQSVHC